MTAGRGAARDQLAAALTEYGVGRSTAPRLADALLPVVDRIANERAAAELERLHTEIRENEDAATDAALEGLDFTLRVLARRAALLRAAATEATT